MEGLREVTKDTTSHLTVAGLVTFADENRLVSIFAVIGSAILVVAWAYHLYKLYHERKEAKATK